MYYTLPTSVDVQSIMALTYAETEICHTINEAYLKINEANNIGQSHTWMVLLKLSCPYVSTVDSRYLEIEGTIINTLRYPYFDISDL